tara:strand:+ start:778 stop:1020 length:243 start_codon:yes stop_codon:yes gene_type:complete
VFDFLFDYVKYTKKINTINMMQKIITLYKEVKQEALKITWPTKPEVITTTIMVFIFVLISSVFFLLIDKIISFAVEFLLF